jgi:hypothetical protein
MLTVLDGLVRNGPPAEHLLTPHDGGALTGATLRTTGRPVHVSAMPVAATIAVESALADADPAVPAAVGPLGRPRRTRPRSPPGRDAPPWTSGRGCGCSRPGSCDRPPMCRAPPVAPRPPTRPCQGPGVTRRGGGAPRRRGSGGGRGGRRAVGRRGSGRDAVGGGRRSGVVGVRATADGRQSRIAPVYTRPGALHTAGAPPPRPRRRGDSCRVPLGPRCGGADGPAPHGSGRPGHRTSGRCMARSSRGPEPKSRPELG